MNALACQAARAVNCAVRRQAGAARLPSRRAQTESTLANCRGDDSAERLSQRRLVCFNDRGGLSPLAESHRSAAPRRAYVRDRSFLLEAAARTHYFCAACYACSTRLAAGATRDAHNRQANQADRSFRGAAPAVPRQRAASDKFRSSSTARRETPTSRARRRSAGERIDLSEAPRQP